MRIVAASCGLEFAMKDGSMYERNFTAQCPAGI
jgi:hypothetical protein